MDGTKTEQPPAQLDSRLVLTRGAAKTGASIRTRQQKTLSNGR